jgi:FkbM family methyltransferase
LTLELAERRIFSGEKFSLVDVGASGGIGAQWYAFGRDLVAVGFDPLVAEVDWLNRANTHSGIRYYSAYVGYGQYDVLFPEGLRGQKVQTHDNQPFRRTSAARACAIRQADGPGRSNSAGATSADRVELDQFLEREGSPNPDFIKVDTDGSDYEVLLGAERALRETPVLGLSVECQFHGPVHPHSNLFSNIDTLLRSLGFSLFDVEPFCYSRATLPRPFRHPFPAQTVEGQVLWAEALYLRDLGDPDYETMWPVGLTPVGILKMACLFEIHGLEDCAAELLLKYRDRVSILVDVDACLDSLTPEFQGRKVSYPEYIRAFEEQTDTFFPARQPETELQTCLSQNRRLAQEIRQLRASWSWRVTAPLRRLADSLGVFRR